MKVILSEVLKANITLVGGHLLSSDEQWSALSEKLGTEVILEGSIPGVAINVTAPGIKSSLDLAPKRYLIGKDRISFQLLPDRTVVEIEYPTTTRMDTLITAVVEAISLNTSTGEVARMFGFNIEAIYKLPSGRRAPEFITQHIFAPEVFPGRGLVLVGGVPRLHFVRDTKHWFINIEPRFGDENSDKVYIAINLHYDKSAKRTDLNRDFLKEGFSEVWKEASSLLKGLQ